MSKFYSKEIVHSQEGMKSLLFHCILNSEGWRREKDSWGESHPPFTVVTTPLCSLSSHHIPS